MIYLFYKPNVTYIHLEENKVNESKTNTFIKFDVDRHQLTTKFELFIKFE